MSMSDPIADFLTRIRNAVHARKKYVEIPASNQKIGIAELMKQNNFIKDFNVIEEGPQKTIRVHLQYVNGTPSITGITKISKPGLRRYVAKDDIPRVLNGLGMAIISTSQGLLTDKQARQQEVGGEVVCHIW
ncbi:MAG: 30S ribosomal protein S8 [Melioribacteraceae bacterium]|jgi:small subunit ribosomal protein S8|nr:30S ribosomal protein S8 [Ignavibacteriota bacterium]MBZ0183892.1 30S ribosomal protein S8 [Melioribacteraceae bacterium]